MGQARRIALLIDAENASAKFVEHVLTEVGPHGVAHVRRAYGNWKSPALQSWEARLHELAIRPVQQFSYTSAKNATDMAMVIDAMDLLHSGNVDCFALMSSDGDFTPLVMRLRADGKDVLGFGEKKTPAPFVNACSRFVHVDNLPVPPTRSIPPPGERWTAKRLRKETELVKVLRASVLAAKNGDGWSDLAAVGSHIQRHGEFNPRSYGCKRLVELFQATALFDVQKAKHGYKVRDRS